MRHNRYTKSIVFLVMALATSVLLGWLMAWPHLTTWTGPVPMVPMTALCLFAIACGEILHYHKASWCEAVAAGVTTFVVMATVGLLLDGPTLWPVALIDHRISGRMAYSTAVSLLILSVAQWWPRAHWVCLGMLWAVVGLSWLSPGVFGDGHWMAWPTMVGLVGLSVSSRSYR